MSPAEKNALVAIEAEARKMDRAQINPTPFTQLIVELDIVRAREAAMPSPFFNFLTIKSP